MTETPLEAVTRRLQAALEGDPNVVFAYVFGSTVRHPERRPRDLDVAVWYADPPGGLATLDEIQRLSSVTGREVDLVVLNDASPLLRHQAVKHGQRLLCRDIVTHTAFRDRTIRDYQTYRHLTARVV